MFKKILLVIAVFIAGICIYAALQPSEFYIARELVIHATPEAIFPFINNNKKANEWMPWKDSDPQAQMIYSGPEEGVGATSTWDSPGQMGTGKAEVVESVANQVVKTKLTYTKPMNMSQLAEIRLRPTDAGTLVRWSINGHNNFIWRIFCIFMNMDDMVGKEFVKGLNNLKQMVESSSAPSEPSTK